MCITRNDIRTNTYYFFSCGRQALFPVSIQYSMRSITRTMSILRKSPQELVHCVERLGILADARQPVVLRSHDFVGWDWHTNNGL